MVVNIVIFLVSICIATSQLYPSYPSVLFTTTPQQNNHSSFSLPTIAPDDPIVQVRSMRRNHGYDYKRNNYNNKFAILEYTLTQQRDSPYHQNRHKTLDKTRNNSKRIKRTTMVNHDIYAFAQKYDIASRDLIYSKFNHYEYQLHKEFLQQLTEATALRSLYRDPGNYSVFIDAIGHGIALGVEANHNKETITATYWADVVWQTIDIAKAVGEGIGLGVYNTAAFGAQVVKGAGGVVFSPLETARTIARGIDAVLSFFALAFDRPKRKVNLYQELDALDERMALIINHCSQQLSHMSLHDKVKFTTAFATEIVAPAKIFKVACHLCNRMRPLTAGLLNSLREERVAIEIAGIGKENILIQEISETAKFKTATQKTAQEGSKIKNNVSGLGPLVPEVADSYHHIIAAVEKIDSNKIHHILTLETKKHAWDKIVQGEVTWEKVRDILIKVMLEGKISPEKIAFKKSYIVEKQLVEVVFAPRADRTISIVDAWVRT